MSVQEANQVFRIVGELQIDATSGYRELKGEINFLGPNKYKYGRLRVIGASGFYSILQDCTGCQQGFNVRTLTNQGDSQIGGTSNQFPFAVVNLETRCIYLVVNQQNVGQNVLFNGQPNLQVSRDSTKDSASKTFPLATFTQTKWKTDERNHILVGYSPFYGFSCIGYHSPSASGTSLTNQGYLGIWNNGNVVENMTWNTDGSVRVNGSFYAGTYLNLPPANVAPLTLDTTNHRVGINQTSPQEALDVTGNIKASGSVLGTQILGDDVIATDITCTTINAGTYLNLPAPDLLPITLDKTNQRVGINNTSPEEALDVTGNIKASGSVLGTQILGDDVIATDITCSTINAGTYLNLPAPDLLPITLDKVNNRVGINKTNPQCDLDVFGNLNAASFQIGNIAFVARYQDQSTAVGRYAGFNTQAIAATALGYAAGNTAQETECVAVGSYAGQMNQKAGALAFGHAAGKDDQAICAVSIGSYAGQTTQGSYAIAIGREAGKTLQGSTSIAIGYLAGVNNQHLNSIILNATKSTLDSDGASRFYVKPVRNATSGNVLGYNATTGEITYAPTTPNNTLIDKPISPTPASLYTMLPEDVGKRLVVQTVYPSYGVIKIVDNPSIPVGSRVGIYTPYTSSSIRNYDIGTLSQINAVITCSLLQPDGKLLVGGNFTVPRKRVARFNQDGTLDTTFGDPDLNGQVQCLELASNGTIYVGGSFTSAGVVARGRVARLLSNGSLDTSFPDLNVNDTVYAIRIRGDSKICVGGAFTTPRQRFLVCDSNGVVDTIVNAAINGTIYCIEKVGGGNVIVGGDFTSIAGVAQSRLSYLDTYGTPYWNTDPGVAGGPVRTILWISSNSFYIGGDFTSVGIYSANKFAHMGLSWLFDTTFPDLGLLATNSVRMIRLLSSGKLLVCGSFTLIQNAGRNGIARLLTTGYLDRTFSVFVDADKPNTCQEFSNGDLFVGGSFVQLNNKTVNYSGLLSNTTTAIQSRKIEPFLTRGLFEQYTNAVLEKLENGVWVVTDCM